MSATTPVSSSPVSSIASTPRWRRSAARVSRSGCELRQLAVAVGPEHQHAHRLLGRDQVAQQQQARLVGPLQVVEHQHDRLVLRHRRPAARRPRRTAGTARCRRRSPSTAAGPGSGSPAPGPAGPAPNRAPSTCATSCVLGRVGDVVAERLGEELVRRGEVLLAVPEQHARPAVERGAGRLGDERGLAQPGLARDEHHLAALAARDALERVRHRRHLGLAADHAHRRAHGQTARQRRPQSSPPPPSGSHTHLDGLDRIGQSLQRQRPDRAALVAAAPTGHQPHDVRREDLPALARAHRAAPPRSPGRRSSRRPRG